MSFDGKTSCAVVASVPRKEPVIGLRSFTQEILAIAIIVICGSVAFLLVDVKKALIYHNNLTDQQIKVTRTIHYIHELAIAHKQGRRASSEAENAEIPPPPKDDFKSRMEFQR